MVDTLFTHDPEQPYNIYAPPSKPKFFVAPNPSVPNPTELRFHLLIANRPDNPGWSNQPIVLNAPVSISLGILAERLRDFLPREPPIPTAQQSRLASLLNRTPRRPLPPRLALARVYLTRAPEGEVVPIYNDNRRRDDEEDVGWEFKECFARMDITARLESEWRILRELIIASRGQFKCYIAIKGQKA